MNSWHLLHRIPNLPKQRSVQRGTFRSPLRSTCSAGTVRGAARRWTSARSAGTEAAQDCGPGTLAFAQLASPPCAVPQRRDLTTASRNPVELARIADGATRPTFYAVHGQTIELVVWPCQRYQRIGVKQQRTLGALRRCHSRREPAEHVRQVSALHPAEHRARGIEVPSRRRASDAHRIEAHGGPSRTARNQASCLSL